MMRTMLGRALILCVVATGCTATASVTPTDQVADVPPQAEVDVTAPSGDDAEGLAAPAVPDISRSDAVAELADVAFLSFADAGCVIDAIHDAVGVYDFTSQLATEQVDQAELIEICTAGGTPGTQPTDSSDASAPEQSADDTEADEPNEDDSGSAQSDGDEESPADPDEGLAEESEAAERVPAPTEDAAQPELVPGAISTGALEIAGSSLGYAVITPSGFTIGDSAPVFIALPDDQDSLSSAAELTEAFFLQAALARGWVVVSPALTGNDPQIVAEVATWIETWVAIQGRPHLGGFGRGGTGAFVIAAQNPSAYQSLMIYPGLAPQPLAASVASLAELPVRMWVINNDGNPWIDSLTAAESDIRAAGGDITLYALALDEALTFESDSDFGELIFAELEALR